jgi:hypothetical protein
MNPVARKQATLGIGGLLLVLCCAAGPAVLGAIGGAATGSVVIGAFVGAAIAVGAYLAIRLLTGRSE